MGANAVKRFLGTRKRGRRAPWIALTLIPVLAISACGDSDAAGPGEGGDSNLTVGVDSDNFMTNVPLYVAIDKGYFEEAGLGNVEVTVTGDNYASGLISGSVDISYAPTVSWFAAGEQSGEDIRWIGPLRDSEFLLLGVREGINDPSDLRGKKVTGGPVGGDNDANLRGVLSELGLSEKDVEIVPTDPGSDAWLAAVLAGQLDGAMMFPRHIAPLEENGGSLLYEEKRDAPQDGYATTGKFLEENAETVEAFMLGLLKAREFYTDKANQDEVFEIMEANGFDSEVVKPAYDIELAQHSVDGGFDAEDMEAMAQRAIEREQMPEATKWHDWVALDALWAAQDELGHERRPAPEDLPDN